MEPTANNPTHDRPPQFGLRTLFVLMAAFSVLFALIEWLGPIWATALIALLFLCAAHVAGAALGTTLRARTDRLCQASRPVASVAPKITPSGLRQRTRVPWMSIVASVLGASAGGWVGGMLALAAYSDRITPSGVSLAVATGAALGGLAGFLAGSFLWVAGRAWREALQRDQPSRGR